MYLIAYEQQNKAQTSNSIQDHLQTKLILGPKKKETLEREFHDKQSRGKYESLYHRSLRRYAFFHESIEMYLDRQWRAYTVPRVGLFWLMSFGLFWNAIGAVAGTFYNVEKLGFRTHPNYKMLGAGWSHFYLIRPFFWGYVTFRMTRWLYNRIKLHWLGFDEDHYFWWYDTAYPDFIYSIQDDRYLNYRYYDTPVTPQTHSDFLKPEYQSARRFQKMSRTPQTFLFNLDPHSKFLSR